MGFPAPPVLGTAVPCIRGFPAPLGLRPLTIHGTEKTNIMLWPS